MTLTQLIEVKRPQTLLRNHVTYSNNIIYSCWSTSSSRIAGKNPFVLALDSLTLGNTTAPSSSRLCSPPSTCGSPASSTTMLTNITMTLVLGSHHNQFFLKAYQQNSFSQCAFESFMLLTCLSAEISLSFCPRLARAHLKSWSSFWLVSFWTSSANTSNLGFFLLVPAHQACQVLWILWMH